MKILQINNFHFPRGGSDRYFMDLMALLSDAGHTVRSFSTANSQNVETERLVGPAAAAINLDNPGAGDIASFLYSSHARRLMAAAIETFKPDIAHLHIYYGQLTASILSPLRRAGIPIVQTLHEYKTVCPTHALMANGTFCDACQGRHFWRAALKRCNRGSFARSSLSATESYISNVLGARAFIDRFIAVSEYQRDQLVQLSLDPERIAIIPNFTRLRPAVSADRGDHLLFVGRIVEGKGLDWLFDAYALLGSDEPPLHVVGVGEAREVLEARATRLGIAERVVWRGFLSGEALAHEYATCIALINPSLLNETFGLTALEGLAYGKPVVVSNRGALPEVVRDRVEGLVVQANDAPALADRIAWISRQDGASFQTAALARARSTFGPETHLKKVEEIYQDLLKERGR
jgi:glycosyltransferase involved in cell wall biosynthesis